LCPKFKFLERNNVCDLREKKKIKNKQLKGGGEINKQTKPNALQD